ncbi:hypothetical protein HAX54_012665, partial [Datura stramonium]|nr:hypothetical protein [Datura stramonium]
MYQPLHQFTCTSRSSMRRAACTSHCPVCTRATHQRTCCRLTSEANSCWETLVPYYFTSRQDKNKNLAREIYILTKPV